MKKLFLTIGISALVIVMVAAVFALLSLFELVHFFPTIAGQELEAFPPDQATILVAYVDSLEERKFQVEEVWLLYVVTSRLDTIMIQEAQQASISPKLLNKTISPIKLIRQVSSDESVEIDYYFLVDGMGRELVNDLLETQQSSIKMNENGSFCEILESDEMQLFGLYIQYAGGHVNSTIPQALIDQFTVNENQNDSLYCESIDP